MCYIICVMALKLLFIYIIRRRITMTVSKKQNRKDNKGRVLKQGESQRKDGTYMYRYTDECKKRHYVYASTLPELREKKLKIEKARMNDIKLSVDYTVDQLVQLKLKVKNNSNIFSNNTRLVYNAAYRCHIKDSWLSYKKIREVKKSDIILFYTELSKTLSNATIRAGVHSLLQQSFKMALEDHIISSDPTSGAVKDFPLDSKTKKTLNQQQVDNLLSYIKDNPYYHRLHPLLTVFIDAMLRGGELCGLTWKDVDLENGFLKIDHQLQYRTVNGKSAMYITTPKTKNGNRKVPLTEKAYAALLQLKEIKEKSDRTSTITIDGYNDFVFLSKSGLPQRINLLNNSFINLENSYNKCHEDQMPHLSCHVFRHTGCTLMAKKMFKLGLDPKILQSWMGHSSLKMTLELYNHVEDIDSQMAMDEINSFTNIKAQLPENKPILVDMNDGKKTISFINSSPTYSQYARLLKDKQTIK